MAPEPANTSDDTYYPTGRIDNLLSIRTLVLSLTLRFNDVLDADKLHEALCTLLSTGDWRRLGGYLRKPAKHDSPRVIRVHVPQTHTRDRPVVAYSRLDLSDVRLVDHELGKDLPSLNGDKPTLYPSGEHYHEFAAAPDMPADIEGFLAPNGQNVPAISLRVTSFADATLVAVAAPHILMDAMAFGELIRAWSLILAGRHDQVPRVIFAREDPTYEAADPALKRDDEQPWSLESVYLTGFAFFLFVVRFLWGVITEPTVESHMVYLPKRVLDKMRSDALQDVAVAAKKPDAAPPPASWVSEGDVLFAWVCRIVSLAQGRSPRHINALNAVNLRNRLPETETNGNVFASNLLSPSFIALSPVEARGPLGLIAAKYRAALEVQTQPDQVRQFLRRQRAAADANKDTTVLFGDPPAGELLSVTNWLKSDVGGSVDFSPAVVAVGDDKDGHSPGSAVYVHSQLHKRSAVVRNTLAIMNKDPAGNVWLQGYFPRRSWEAMRRELDEIDKA